MFIIYSEHKSKRLDYVLERIFSESFKKKYTHTTDVDFYKSSSDKKINYSNNEIEDEEFFIHATSSFLLYENAINNIKINVGDVDGVKIIFPVKKACDFPFDIFSAVFYMLSRYEEYLPYIKDKHDRFKPEESLAYNNGFLNKPVVDIWINLLKIGIEKKFNISIPETSEFKFTPTIDIDIAYAYKSKGVYRTFFGYLRSLYTGNFDEILLRSKINLGLTPDPYDTFDYIISLQENHDLKTLFFVLVGEHSKYDKNAPFKNNAFRQLIRHLADFSEVGIHPSYNSLNDASKISDEIERLKEMIRKDIKISRQHYLRFTLPNTYRYLIDNNINEDYSMGFASELGFRAGTCKPFYFFDLDSNSKTTLRVFPITIMDGTLRDYLKKTPEESLEIISTLMKEVKNVNGHFISLFHNESLSNCGKWKGWKSVYEEMIKMALL